MCVPFLAQTLAPPLMSFGVLFWHGPYNEESDIFYLAKLSPDQLAVKRAKHSYTSKGVLSCIYRGHKAVSAFHT
jgi:hypothetical protein